MSKIHYTNPLHAIRHKNLKELIERHYNGSQSALASAIERTPGMVSQWLSGHRKMGEKAARLIEKQLSLQENTLDTQHVELSDKQINLNDLEALLFRVNRDLKNIEALLGKNEPDDVKALSATMDARVAITKLRALIEKPDEKKD